MNDSLQRLDMDKVLERIAFHASFSLGKDAILKTKPSYSRMIVQRDLNRLEDAMKVLEDGHSLGFGGISDVSYVLSRAEKHAVLIVQEIVQISRFMQGVGRLKKQFNKFEENYEHLNDLFASLIINEQLLKHLNHSFSDQGEVLDRASSEIRNVRQEIRTMEQKIDEASHSFIKKNKDMLTEQVVSLQQGRRTFLIKPSDKYKLPGTVYGQSASGQSIYFEPQSLTRMQNDLHGLKMREKQEIERICIRTSGMIAEDALQLNANLDTVTIIDALFAKALWGRQEEAVVATLTDNKLDLVQARHPLIPKEEAVLNDYRLTEPYRSILISGPNTGGKSVSLKVIGLSVLLSLSGCPVIAKNAKVMLVDQVFVDIGDQQSIEKSLSSFSAHIETIKYILNHATNKSLVLLDELGSQTDPLEGESLAMAILDELRKRGSLVVATTHFSRLKKYATQHKDMLIASVEFDMETLQPTYRYKENLTGESNALSIARRLNLDASVLDSAFRYKQENQYEEDHLLEILEGKIAEQERIQKEYENELSELQIKEAELNQEKLKQEEDLKDYEKELEEKINRELNELISKANKELERLNKTARPDIRKEAVKNIEKLQEKAPQESININDRVRLKSSQQIATVHDINKKEATVQIGAIRMQVPLTKLERVSGPIKKAKKRPTHTVRSHSNYQIECNVIGKRVAEALPLVDQYIDDTILKGMNKARIVHGHGTGQLRQAIHQRLRKNKQVKDFSLAPISEGGAGATVVTLKE